MSNALSTWALDTNAAFAAAEADRRAALDAIHDELRDLAEGADETVYAVLCDGEQVTWSYDLDHAQGIADERNETWRLNGGPGRRGPGPYEVVERPLSVAAA
jgi:DNA-binding IclR family transcriptional regulator